MKKEKQYGAKSKTFVLKNHEKVKDSVKIFFSNTKYIREGDIIAPLRNKQYSFVVMKKEENSIFVEPLGKQERIDWYVEPYFKERDYWVLLGFREGISSPPTKGKIEWS